MSSRGRSWVGVFLGVFSGIFLLWIFRYAPDKEGRGAAVRQTPRKLGVVAVQTIFADWARQIGADRVRVVSLVPEQGDPHHVEPTPHHALELAGADILIEMGLGFEDPWLPALYRSTRCKAKRLVLSEGLPVLRAGASIEDKQSSHLAQPGEDADPHLWLDVSYAKKMTQAIYEAFAAQDEKGAAYYKERFELYAHQLDLLDEEIRRELAAIPQERRYLVTYHDSMRYFAAAYGLHYLGNAMGPGTNLISGAPAGHLAHLADVIVQHKIPALFPEAGHNNALLKQLATETHTRLAPELHVGALSKSGGPATSYIDLMRHIARTLALELAYKNE